MLPPRAGTYLTRVPSIHTSHWFCQRTHPRYVCSKRTRFLVTGPEAARRAGRYQAEWGKQGRTIHTPDALIGATARAYGAVLLTHNLADFPIRDVRVEPPGAAV